MRILFLCACILFSSICTKAKTNNVKISLRSTYGLKIINKAKIKFKNNWFTVDTFGEAQIKMPVGKQSIFIVTKGSKKNYTINVSKENFTRSTVLIKSNKTAIHANETRGYKTKIKYASSKTPRAYKMVAGASKSFSKIDALVPPKEDFTTATSTMETPTPLVGTEVKAAEPIALPIKKMVPEIAPLEKAGLLTTGEINDFTKWNLWSDLSETELLQYKKLWQFNLKNRYVVQLVNANNNPIVNAKVSIVDKGDNWMSFTDNTGKAELWLSTTSEKSSNDKEINILYNNKTYSIKNPKLFEASINYLQLPVECSYSNNVDISFVIDATGSMGDELSYLQTEVKDVIRKVNSINKNLNINTSVVFYQDITDEYLTSKNDFTSNLNSTINFINKHSVGDGGDYPEAVDEALSVAIEELSWRPEARTKILFLVLDAPPHQDEATRLRYLKLVKLAALKGVRIVPLSGSGIDKSTEYLMRATALATNGTYAFLTNNSGIGNAHLAPSTNNFKVEKMNDLLIRIITQFTFIPDCGKKELEQNNNNPFSLIDVIKQIKVYPNPSNGLYNIEKPMEATEILITDIAGKIIKRVTALQSNTCQVDITGHPTGIYFIRVQVEGNWLTQKVVLQ